LQGKALDMCLSAQERRKMDIKRVFIIVLDSVGIGAAPDAADFGDAGANTMFRIFDSDKFNIYYQNHSPVYQTKCSNNVL
jgi:hypothetical protein